MMRSLWSSSKLLISFVLTGSLLLGVAPAPAVACWGRALRHRTHA